MPENRVRVGILGVTGHTGAELLRWLQRHPKVEVVYLGARQRYASVKQVYPWAQVDLPVEEIDCNKIRQICDCVFLALPHTVSQHYVPQLYPETVVIDLSADYRLKRPKVYEKWYKISHSSSHLLREAVYGLPELFREKIAKARLIANPGCYPTAVILGLFPLAKEKLLESVIVDAKSGASGAGKKLLPNLLFAELIDNLYPYKPNLHQHIPEILQILQVKKEQLIFVPHIVGIERGILATMYVKLFKRIKKGEVEALFRDYYQNEPFIILSENMPSYRMLHHTNNCHISVRLLDGKTLLVVSAIDNLVKGASGQAIQNMNIVFGLEEKEGLV